MLTILTAPRPFADRFAEIQHNALLSWTLLDPAPEIIVFGDEAGTAAVCDELGLRHVRGVRCAPTGAPMLDDILSQGQQLASNDVIAYVNPDIILLQDFVDSVQRLRKVYRDPFVVAAPWNLHRPLSTDDVRTGIERAMLAREASSPREGSGADAFVFTNGTLGRVPPVAIGRLGWDNWLLWKAATSRGAGIDATAAMTLVHQDHSGTTHRGSVKVTHDAFSEEVRKNLSTLRWFQAATRRSDMRLVLDEAGVASPRRRLGIPELLLRTAGRHARLRAKPFVTRHRLLRPFAALYRSPDQAE